MAREQTSLERLEEAVAVFVADTGCDDALAGWVLAYQTSRIVEEPDTLPIKFSSDYTLGPTTSAPLAVGLASFAIGVLEDAPYGDDEE